MSSVQVSPSIVMPGAEGDRIQFRGYDIIFKSGSDPATEWMIVDYTLPAHQTGAPLHYHEHLIESFYVISGELWMRVGEREFVAGPGSCALVPPGTPHAFANRSDAPARFLGHASSPRHKEFLKTLIRMAMTEGAWPPADPQVMIELGKRYDTVYL